MFLRFSYWLIFDFLYYLIFSLIRLFIYSFFSFEKYLHIYKQIIMAQHPFKQ